LAHITTIEAALGLQKDHHGRTRPKFPGAKHPDPGATARVAARLSSLLGSKDYGVAFGKLFGSRSAYLHGRSMPRIAGDARISARRLARETVLALITAAGDSSAKVSRESYLDALLESEDGDPCVAPGIWLGELL